MRTREIFTFPGSNYDLTRIESEKKTGGESSVYHLWGCDTRPARKGNDSRTVSICQGPDLRANMTLYSLLVNALFSGVDTPPVYYPTIKHRICLEIRRKRYKRLSIIWGVTFVKLKPPSCMVSGVTNASRRLPNPLDPSVGQGFRRTWTCALPIPTVPVSRADNGLSGNYQPTLHTLVCASTLDDACMRYLPNDKIWCNQREKGSLYAGPSAPNFTAQCTTLPSFLDVSFHFLCRSIIGPPLIKQAILSVV